MTVWQNPSPQSAIHQKVKCPIMLLTKTRPLMFFLLKKFRRFETPSQPLFAPGRISTPWSCDSPPCSRPPRRPPGTIVRPKRTKKTKKAKRKGTATVNFPHFCFPGLQTPSFTPPPAPSRQLLVLAHGFQPPPQGGHWAKASHSRVIHVTQASSPPKKGSQTYVAEESRG